MNEKLSALMDGELTRDEAMAVIRGLGGDAAQREQWDAYHLIGACLRGDAAGDVGAGGLAQSASTAAIFERLAAEPTVVVPAVAAAVRRPAEHRTRLVLAVAASVVTISAVGVIVLKQESLQGPAPANVAAGSQQVAEVAAQRARAEARVNDYLVVHRQFANAHAGALQSAALPREASQDQTKKAAGR